MKLNLRCLECGFQFTVNLPLTQSADAVAKPVACGKCGCTRWTASSA